MSGGSGRINLHGANIIQANHISIIGHSYQMPRYVVLSEMRCFDTDTWAFKIRCDDGRIIVSTATRVFGHNGRIYYSDCDGRITASIHTYYKWKLFYMGIAQDGEFNDIFFEMLKYYHLL
jgi:hypothetical protein